MPLVYCSKCGAKVADEYSYCTNCQAPFVKGTERLGGKETKPPTRTEKASDAKANSSKTQTTPHEDLMKWLFTPPDTNRKSTVRGIRNKPCVNCGVEVALGSKFCPSCGQALTIRVEEVLNSTFRILGQQPVIFLPIFVEVLFSRLLFWWIFPPFRAQLASTTNPALSLEPLLTSLLPSLAVGIVFGSAVGPLVHGMYPTMVKTAMGGGRIDLIQPFRNMIRKYRSLFVSNILINLEVIMGTLMFVVPGIIVATWYYFTYPAIIFEDRGARDGMSASKAFARDRKWETFVMLLVASIPAFVSIFVNRTVPISVQNFPIYLTLNLIFSVVTGILNAVMASYTYLAYAMPKQ